MADKLNIGVTAPFEGVAIALIDLAKTTIEGQPPEVKKQIWDWIIQDIKAWRKLWGLEDNNAILGKAESSR